MSKQFDHALAQIPADIRAALATRFADFTAHLDAINPDIFNELVRCCACSDFVFDWCLRDTTALVDLINSGDLHRSYSATQYRDRLQNALRDPSQTDTKRALRVLRNREMVRIAWRDFHGAPLNETLSDLSHLAEACVHAAVQSAQAPLQARYGKPFNSNGNELSLVVIAMGKLGAHELNYSSDIDLIFVYAEEGETQGGRQSVSHHEYFVHLARALIDLLNTPTADGFVFRTDARLRPFGNSGALAISFDAFESYYERHGREWERYAMIKANVIHGGQHAADEIQRRIRPFVYRRYLDYAMFDALREMKAMIEKEAARKGMEDNVKLGLGGIREIEFAGQAYQLIRGGREPRLQQRPIQTVLTVLGELSLLPPHMVNALLEAYDFLRKTENRIQAYADRQTHNLPTDTLAQSRLAFAMGFENWDAFVRQLDKHRSRVRQAFDQVFMAPQTDTAQTAGSNPFESLWQGTLSTTEQATLLQSVGYSAPIDAVQLIDVFRNGSVVQSLTPRGRARLDNLMPLLLGALTKLSPPDRTLSLLIQLLERVARRTAYLALLAEHPLAVSQLVQLCHRSPWIAEQITRHPLLLDELLDPRRLYEMQPRAEMERELTARLATVPADDVEQQMEILRQFKQAISLRVAAAELTGALPINRVSDQLTDVAETVIGAVLRLTWQQQVARHSAPFYTADGERKAAGFAVIAYGKLGGYELGFGSDLDLVFLHDSHGEEQQTDGDKSVDNAVFFARLGQRIIHFLNTPTAGGVLYEVDTRLRPSGGSGLLVSSLTAFTDYQHHSAWTWEHQALVRARPVAGSAEIAQQFLALRKAVLQRERDPATLRDEVRQMRLKMREALSNKQAGVFDLKQGEGGITDIEFLAQYLVLRHAREHPALTVWPDNLRILEAAGQAKLLSPDDATMLPQAYLAYRHRAHELALQQAPALANDTEFRPQRELVRRVWSALLEP